MFPPTLGQTAAPADGFDASPAKASGGLRAAARDDRGTVAIVFVVSMIPVLALVGSAIDYQRAVATRTRMQSALDAATLAGAKLTTPSERIKVARDVFDSNMSVLGVNNYVPVFTPQPDNSFAGQAVGEVETTFMKIVNISTMKVSVSARAAPASASTPTALTFSALSAKGWYWKSVTLWVHRPGDPTDTALATFTYQPTSLLNGGTGSLSGPFGSQIQLGSTYDKLYLTMQVIGDGCAPNYAPRYPQAIEKSDWQYWDPYECVPASATYVKKATPYNFSTLDPATANHLFVDGKQLPVGTAIEPMGLAKCDSSVVHGWEDTKDWNPSDPENRDAWQSQDFNFKVVGGPCASNASFKTSSMRLLE